MARVQTGLQLNRGLVGYWPLGNKGTAQGSVAVDLSGRQNYGTIAGFPTPVPSISGRGITFDGLSSVVNFRTGLSVSPLTICGWFKYTSGVVALSMLSPSTSNWDGWYIQVSGGAWNFEAASNNSFGTSVSGAAARVGLWDFVCAVVVANNNRLIYVNGIASAADTSSITPSFSDIRLNLGASVRSGVTDNYWAGAISGVRLYNRALSSAEIWQLYKQRNPSGGLITPSRRIINAASVSSFQAAWAIGHNQVTGGYAS